MAHDRIYPEDHESPLIEESVNYLANHFAAKIEAGELTLAGVATILSGISGMVFSHYQDCLDCVAESAEEIREKTVLVAQMHAKQITH